MKTINTAKLESIRGGFLGYDYEAIITAPGAGGGPNIALSGGGTMVRDAKAPTGFTLIELL